MSLSENKTLKLIATTTPQTPQDGPWIYDLTWDDATWILTASFIIFTMQTGFGMLESGCVSIKNETNIMMKNVVDVVFGGLTYWMFGFGISFGTDAGSSPYFGIGQYFVDSEFSIMGPVFAAFMFQLSFATTATTIVSGAMAERCNFRAYCLFSLMNTVVYCVPARWIWGPTGFLLEMGVIDIAGSGAVHLLGGVSGFVGAWMLGPRVGRYDLGTQSLSLGNPSGCIVGLWILWWGWLAFNSGSTFGVSGNKWKFSARASVTTMMASIGGGLVGSLYGFFKPGTNYFGVMDIVNPVLGGLVSITAGCALYHVSDAFFVGVVGGVVVLLLAKIPDLLGVDDPVGAAVVHGFGGLWGMIAVGLFAEDDQGLGFTKENQGLFRGGGVKLLQIQLFACICIIVWSATSTFLILFIINKIIPIRMEEHEELLGADFVEHLIRRGNAGLTPVISALKFRTDVKNTANSANFIGAANPVHDRIIDVMNDIKLKTWKKIKVKYWAINIFNRSLEDRRKREEVKNVVDDFLGNPMFTLNSNYNSAKDYRNNYGFGANDTMFGQI